MTWSACSVPDVTTTTISERKPSALERGGEVPGVLDEPDDIILGRR
jgi:hypothetical protein